jgi:hypothetical protein
VVPSPAVQADLELSLVESFLRLPRARGYMIGDPQPGDTNLREPDFVCQDAKAPGGVVGFEVTAGYYNAQHAKDRREIFEGHPERSSRVYSPGSTPWDAARRLPSAMRSPTEMLVAHLNADMVKKAAKRYSTGRTYLLLDGRWAFVTPAHLSSASRILQELEPPLGHPFQTIFLALPRSWPRPGEDPVEWARVLG